MSDKNPEYAEVFLSDPRPIIVYHCHWLTDSLPNSCLVDLINVTLACEVANSKLVDIVIVADIGAEKRVDDSLAFGTDLEA